MSELNKVIKDINKTYGEGTVCLASDAKVLPIRRIEWGIFSLDCELGGGLPYGRVVQLHGPYSSGKTTLALHLARNVQKSARQKMVAWIDAEGAFDTEWAKSQGVDLTKLIICRPDAGQKGLDIAEELVRTRECGLLVVDSLANIVPKEELENSMEDQQMGLLARVINKFIRKVTMALQPIDGMLEEKNSNDCIVLLLNQERATMDKYHPITTPGGMGKDFASSITVSIRRGTWIAEKQGDQEIVVGYEIFFKIEKNKTAPPKRDGTFDFYLRTTPNFNVGEVDNMKSVILYGIQHNIIERKGSFYTFNGKRCQGKEEIIEYLKKSPDEYELMKNQVLKLYSVNMSIDTGGKHEKEESRPDKRERVVSE